MDKKKKLNNCNKKENVIIVAGEHLCYFARNMWNVWIWYGKTSKKERQSVGIMFMYESAFLFRMNCEVRKRESEGDRRESWKQILQMIIDNNFSAFPFKCSLSLFSYSNKRKDFYINEWMNDILNEMNMIRVGEIHGPWLLVRSRVGVCIYVTCCCVGSTQFFICLELKLHWLAVGFGQHV